MIKAALANSIEHNEDASVTASSEQEISEKISRIEKSLRSLGYLGLISHYIWTKRF